MQHQQPDTTLCKVSEELGGEKLRNRWKQASGTLPAKMPISEIADKPASEQVDGKLVEEEKARLKKQRCERIGKATKLFFSDDPIHVSYGKGQYLYDTKGRRYLDCISNVQHVGHAHPAVADAAYKQMLLTNCNIRFLHDKCVQLSNEIAATLPQDLEAFFFCNSGSEANDLAYRMCLEVTGGTEFIVLDGAYHGHVSSAIGLSPYKFKGPGGEAAGVANPHVHVAPVPDVYRGIHRLADDELSNEDKLREAGRAYARDVKEIIDRLKLKGLKVAGFFMEAFQSCGGQIITPPSFLEDVTRYIHEAGGFVVVDEVQTGFGRVGSRFWAFQTQGEVVPDMVTMGKPMGNGFPIAALVTTRNVNERFGQAGMEYFNTYGGNPVSAAVGLAVLRVMREEGLQKQAKDVGDYFLHKLRDLQAAHKHVIGDVRGYGMFIGMELILDARSRTPLPSSTVKRILNEMRNRDVIINSEGPDNNVIKIKPPICFTKDNVDEVCSKLGEVLTLVCSATTNTRPVKNGATATNGHA